MVTVIIEQEKHPSVPLFLVGHSMGGMIALRCVIRSVLMISDDCPPFTLPPCMLAFHDQMFPENVSVDNVDRNAQESRTVPWLCSQWSPHSAWISGIFCKNSI